MAVGCWLLVAGCCKSSQPPVRSKPLYCAVRCCTYGRVAKQSGTARDPERYHRSSDAVDVGWLGLQIPESESLGTVERSLVIGVIDRSDSDTAAGHL